MNPAEILKWFQTHHWIYSVGASIVLLLVFIVFQWLSRKLVYFTATTLVAKNDWEWEKVLHRNKFFARTAHLLQAAALYYILYFFPYIGESPRKIVSVVIAFLVARVFDSLLVSFSKIYSQLEVARSRPIKGYIAAIRIFTYIFATLIIVSIVINKSPWILLSGLGAITAVLVLVFRDTILSFVASVKIYSNNMLRIGDWIEMPRFGADGNVIDIDLYHVKVQNWDKTLIYIPTFRIDEEAIKNWRGMQESGGRRIKRSVYLDVNSIKFCDRKLITSLKKNKSLVTWLNNIERGPDNTAEDLSSSNCTNSGLFRKYLQDTLRKRKDVHPDYTFMVRYLQSNEHGLPLEIYLFANTVVWTEFEEIQANIFDHIIAKAPEFSLKISQFPTGQDFQNLSGTNRKNFS